MLRPQYMQVTYVPDEPQFDFGKTWRPPIWAPCCDKDGTGSGISSVYLLHYLTVLESNIRIMKQFVRETQKWLYFCRPGFFWIINQNDIVQVLQDKDTITKDHMQGLE